MPFSILSGAARMFSAASEHRSRRVSVRNALRWAGLAVLAVLLPAGMPLAAQTVQFTGAVNTLSNQFGSPAGVAVDQYGNVFVTDNLFNGVGEILAVNGSIPGINSTTVGIGSGFNRPGGVAVDQ